MSRCKLDTDVHKIFSCKVSFKCCCQVDSWLLIKNLNIAVIKHFRDDTFGKINITTEVVFIQLLSYNVVSKQKKIKIKMTTQNATAYSYNLKVTSTQSKGASFFS